MKKKPNQQTEEDKNISERDTTGANWREIQEQQAWDDFLAWCREQENSPHE